MPKSASPPPSLESTLEIVPSAPVATGNGDEPPPPLEGEAEKQRIEALKAKYVGEPGFFLNPPIEYQGRTVEFISIDLSKLKGADLKAIGREFKARFKPIPGESYFLDNDYLILLFARINDLDEGFFDRLNGNAYLQLTEFYKIRMKTILGE
jgi:hypothetical protein